MCSPSALELIDLKWLGLWLLLLFFFSFAAVLIPTPQSVNEFQLKNSQTNNKQGNGAEQL
jgi:hypothetical protein